MFRNLILVLTLVTAAAILPSSATAEEPMPTAPSRPATTKLTKRAVTELAVFDMCDLASARECVIWNQLDVAIMIKYVTTSSVCTYVPIDTGADTDVLQIPAGGSFTGVLGKKPTNQKDHTFCAKAVSAPSSGAVYTIEAS